MDIKYILLDLGRYDDEALLKLCNLIGSVFLIDKQRTQEKLFEKTKEALKIIEDLEIEQQQIKFLEKARYTRLEELRWQ